MRLFGAPSRQRAPRQGTVSLQRDGSTIMHTHQHKRSPGAENKVQFFMLIVAYALAALEIACAAAIILITALQLVDWVHDDPATGEVEVYECLLSPRAGPYNDGYDSRWQCNYAFIVCSISVALSLTICFVECLPYNPCGLRTIIDVLLTAVGFGMWAAISGLHVTNDFAADDARPIPQEFWRETAWVLTWVATVLFALEVVVKVVYVCCRPRVRRGMPADDAVELAVYRDADGTQRTARIVLKYLDWAVDASGAGISASHAGATAGARLGIGMILGAGDGSRGAVAVSLPPPAVEISPRSTGHVPHAVFLA